MLEPNHNVKSGNASDQSAHSGITPPYIALPLGGGAIRAIGEKFGANLVTGTSSMAVPVFTSASRSELGPQLSLSYNSCSGNGPFGFAWNLDILAITRKTDKGLAEYRDEEDSDISVLSGAEDEVPVLIESGRPWQREALPVRSVDGIDYRIQRYLPRIEGLFARSERWTSLQSGETHWRSISRDNITTLYGASRQSRIGDAADPTRTFSWLICESYDDRGNAVVYSYREENSDCVDLSQANETREGDA